MTYPINFWKVGGAVRDSLLGVQAKDVDFAVEAPSFDAMREAIVARGGKIFLETPEFFTIRAKVPNLGASDFVLCRKDGAYRDGRHPESVEVGTILDDLRRRDFTMNAIAISADTGLIYDPLNGREDIHNRIIRAVGLPLDRFKEDRLRVFRAIRFAVQKGFAIEVNTAWAMTKVIRMDWQAFKGVSTERIREELLKMFAADWIGAFNMLNSFELLPMIEERGIWLKPTTEAR
jgi:tRNA nucleotidyltransferase/poly(A) polymerase